ncbi:putative GAG-pre-integrase domain-containing protein [Rosa chinensis]|uniref:Putative GAG-pre-integrase domain-containing protein n=1 Tax=Rosa chinensis TaxID=74649 RepID=A0A2P6S0C8_ROSCH|nr:putative GAG-pre-integrase domain-containing protein [Rosa chinensis]
MHYRLFCYLVEKKCILKPQDLATKRTIGLGKERDGLYYLVALAAEQTKPSITRPSRSSCNLAISSTNLWHNRLGHVSSPCLSHIAKHFLHFSI